MFICQKNKKPASIYLGNVEINNIYYKGINIWPDALNLLSCFALGYWDDSYEWTDDYPWKDNV